MRTDNLLDGVIKKLTDQIRHDGAAQSVTVNSSLFGMFFVSIPAAKEKKYFAPLT